MDQLIFASLSHTHYWYEVGMFCVLEILGMFTAPTTTTTTTVGMYVCYLSNIVRIFSPLAFETVLFRDI